MTGFRYLTYRDWSTWASRIDARLEEIGDIMTEINADQAHLDADVKAETDAFATVIAELKAQHAAGAPLDFTAADKFLASVQGEAVADAPPTPPPAP